MTSFGKLYYYRFLNHLKEQKHPQKQNKAHHHPVFRIKRNTRWLSSTLIVPIQDSFPRNVTSPLQVQPV